MDAGTVPQLPAEALWRDSAAIDLRTGIDGRSPHVQQALGDDTIPVENALRRIAIGKNNRLFATAKPNGLDVARRLAEPTDILPTCPDSRIDSGRPFAHATQPLNDARWGGGRLTFDRYQ